MSQNNISDICFEDIFEELLTIPLTNSQSPIVYSPDYDITLAGIEKWYPFDTCKSSKIFNHLKDAGILCQEDVISPKELSLTQLQNFHSAQYLNNIKLTNLIEGFYNSSDPSVARYSEYSSWLMLPWFVLNSRLLAPMRLQTAGSLLAGMLCLKHGWSINLGGGFNHCLPHRAGAYSAYDDISITTAYLLTKLSRVMIVDLCAQQCNGPARRFMNDPRVHLLDVFNQDIYPYDGFAKRGIGTRGLTGDCCRSKEYLALVRVKLDEAMEEFLPEAVVYVAGVDVLQDDPAGNMHVSFNAITERDQIVFLKVRSRGIPVVMLCGSGFTPTSYLPTAASIINLQQFGLISIINQETKNERHKNDSP